MPDPRVDPRQLKVELASKQSNLRYSTIIELLAQEAYEVTDVTTLVSDASSIIDFVFAPLASLEEEEEVAQSRLFEAGAYL